MKESDFQNTIIEYAHLRGWMVAHFRTARIQRRDGSVYYATPVQADGEGFPDLIMLRGLEMVIAEIKADKGILSEAQRDWIQLWGQVTKDVYVWRPKDWDEIESRLK